MSVWIPAGAHFLRDFTLEKKNDRLKILESIKGGREVQKSLNLAYDSVKMYRGSILWDENKDVLECQFVNTS
jgi:hypothetical protein